MIVVRKSDERRWDRSVNQDLWLTFEPGVSGPKGRFGAMEAFQEGRFFPRSAMNEPWQEGEVITYVREGALAFEDSDGQSGVLRTGDFQRLTTGTGFRYREMNVSSANEAHVFQIRLTPKEPGPEPGYDRCNYSVAERRGRLCCVASSDEANGALLVHQDAHLYSGIFARGQRVVHELASGRGAWVHVVEGSLNLGEHVLNTGDGAGVESEVSAAMTALDTTEVLLLDVGNFDTQHRRTNGSSAIRVRPPSPPNLS